MRIKPRATGPDGQHSPETVLIAWSVKIYARSLHWVLENSFVVMLVLLAVIGLNGYLYVAIPKTFFPQQDTGMLQGFVNADQSMSFQAMLPKVQAFAEIVGKDPAVDSVTASVGGGGGPGGGGG